MNEIANINTNDYTAMAKAMGMVMDTGANKDKADALARVRINHSPIMGRSEVNGKMVNVEVVWWYIQNWTYQMGQHTILTQLPYVLTCKGLCISVL